MEAETHIINSFLTVYEGLTKKSPSYPQLVTEFIRFLDLHSYWKVQQLAQWSLCSDPEILMTLYSLFSFLTCLSQPFLSYPFIENDLSWQAVNENNKGNPQVSTSKH